MPHTIRTLILTASLSLAALPAAHAQARPTARQAAEISAWAGLTGTYIGLNDGKNLGISAGADLTLRRYFGVNPSLEVRGNYPINSGQVAGERSIQAGLKVERAYGRLHPYAAIFVGRGQLNYIFPLPNASFTFFYIQTTSNLFAPAVGVDLDLTPHFAFKADVQLEHWSTPVTPTGHIYSEPITAGVVYRFDFNGRRHFPIH